MILIVNDCDPPIIVGIQETMSKDRIFVLSEKRLPIEHLCSDSNRHYLRSVVNLYAVEYPEKLVRYIIVTDSLGKEES